jgi:flagellar basal-body rod modification protein FlgD
MAGISNPAVSANSVVNTPISTGGAGEGGYLVNKKDEKAPETAAQFGEVLKSIQSKYGAKPDKAREIKKTLGKDDFLKIMITQMKNQDPTKPFNADEMAAQMAQYASVEQLQNVNQNLNKMQTDHQSSDRMAMTSMIGKTITVDRERFPHTEGVNESLGYTLTKNASEVKLSVINEAGETVFEKDIGAQKAGEQTYGWDGVKTNTLPAKTGGYTFKITAKDEHGAALPTNPKTQGKVIGVSFEGSEPTLLIGDAHQQQKVTMKNVIQVDDMVEEPRQIMPTLPGGQALQGPQAKAPQASAQSPGGNFFTFSRGVGSQNIDPAALSPEAQQALAKYQAQRSAAQGGPAANATGGASANGGSSPSGLGSSGRDAEPVDGSTSGVQQQPSQLAQGAAQIGAGEKGFPSGVTE